MSLILKSNKPLLGVPLLPQLRAYKQRVIADGGMINDNGKLLSAFLFMQDSNFDSSKIFSATSASWGLKVVDGYVTKLYNLFDPSGDIVLLRGSYAVNQVNGRSSFFATGAYGNTFQSQGEVSSINLSAFMAYEKETGSPTNYGAIFEVQGVDVDERGIVIVYRQPLSDYSFNAYGNSGELEGVPLLSNVSASVTTSGLNVYQNGGIVANDTTVTPIAATRFKAYLASFALNSMVSGGAKGNYFASIFANDLSVDECKSMSLFVSTY